MPREAPPLNGWDSLANAIYCNKRLQHSHGRNCEAHLEFITLLARGGCMQWPGMPPTEANTFVLHTLQMTDVCPPNTQGAN